MKEDCLLQRVERHLEIVESLVDGMVSSNEDIELFVARLLEVDELQSGLELGELGAFWQTS
jgi:hypothetical protein